MESKSSEWFIVNNLQWMKGVQLTYKRDIPVYEFSPNFQIDPADTEPEEYFWKESIGTFDTMKLASLLL